MPSIAFAVPSPGQAVGEYLREQRQRAGLTQIELARRSGVKRTNIAAIEAGRRAPSADMTTRLLAAIRGQPWPVRERLHLSPAVLINIEVARVAAFKVIEDPELTRKRMVEYMADLRERNDGSSRRWLNFWDDVLAHWSTGDLVAFLLSTDPEDVDLRKVSPIPALVTETERAQATTRARKVWRAAS